MTVINHKLSVAERKLLGELSHPRSPWKHAGHMKATTNRLIERGFVTVRGRKIASTGRMMHAGEVQITDEGRIALARSKP